MQKLRSELHQYIERYGVGSIEALEVSKKLDLVIVKEQQRLINIKKLVKPYRSNVSLT